MNPTQYVHINKNDEHEMDDYIYEIAGKNNFCLPSKLLSVNDI